jgi:hypothetical protein
MDFLDTSKKIALQKFYNKDLIVMPNKQIKPLRFNKTDKIVIKIQNEIDIIGNVAALAVKFLKQMIYKHNLSGQKFQKLKM